MNKEDFLKLSESFKPVRFAVNNSDSVYIRSMTIAERDAFDLANSKSLMGVRARLIALCVCDEAGSRLFADTELGSLSKMPATILESLFEACQTVNGMRSEDVEVLEKN